jgi:hypothetical protein
MQGEKEFKTAVRLERAIKERMPRGTRETGEMRRFSDAVKRQVDDLAKKLDK